MLQTRHLAKTALFGTLALSTALAACGPSPTAVLPGNPANAKLTAIAVSEISPENAVSSNISLGWEAMGSSVSSIKLFRRRADQTANDVTEITEVGPTRTTHEDKDSSLVPGTQYVYVLRADNSNRVAVASAQSQPISIIDAKAIPSFRITSPASNDSILKDPLGTGHTFSWEDSGTGLYHVQVSDASGTVLWGGMTKATSISYGTQSGTTKTGGISSPADPKLMVPLALTSKLVVSSVAPNTSRNEVPFKGIGGTGSYRLQVAAIETQPVKGDVANAQSIAIRKAAEVRFLAQ